MVLVVKWGGAGGLFEEAAEERRAVEIQLVGHILDWHATLEQHLGLDYQTVLDVVLGKASAGLVYDLRHVLGRDA